MSVYTAISHEPIDPAAVLRRVGGPGDGAVLLFLGTVRDQHEERAVTGLHYDAYAAMAEHVLAEIAGEAARRCGSARIAVVHRIGELAVGDVSVAIAISTPHRAEAYEGSRYIIEQIKVRLPVWKQERYRDGEARWLEGAVPPEASP